MRPAYSMIIRKPEAYIHKSPSHSCFEHTVNADVFTFGRCAMISIMKQRDSICKGPVSPPERCWSVAGVVGRGGRISTPLDTAHKMWTKIENKGVSLARPHANLKKSA